MVELLLLPHAPNFRELRRNSEDMVDSLVWDPNPALREESPLVLVNALLYGSRRKDFGDCRRCVSLGDIAARAFPEVDLRPRAAAFDGPGGAMLIHESIVLMLDKCGEPWEGHTYSAPSESKPAQKDLIDGIPRMEYQTAIIERLRDFKRENVVACANVLGWELNWRLRPPKPNALPSGYPLAWTPATSPGGRHQLRSFEELAAEFEKHFKGSCFTRAEMLAMDTTQQDMSNRKHQKHVISIELRDSSNATFSSRVARALQLREAGKKQSASTKIELGYASPLLAIHIGRWYSFSSKSTAPRTPDNTSASTAPHAPDKIECLFFAERLDIPEYLHTSVGDTRLAYKLAGAVSRRRLDAGGAGDFVTTFRQHDGKWYQSTLSSQGTSHRRRENVQVRCTLLCCNSYYATHII